MRIRYYLCYDAMMNTQRDWMTAAEVAAELGVTPGRVRQWLAKGDMPSEKVGGTRLVQRAAIEPFRSRKTAPGPAPRPKPQAAG